ncbi:uncharacterized protein LOC111598696 [Drosophila hydei]|uniref:Uncharacterized protein LOC111598696 n=1 Tax=Drosophila hydei TaxID=7224 RepID=A0A6J1LWD2_DROHY|nr:uncharacterized protein LOC111598696 [Drosophila hydei]
MSKFSFDIIPAVPRGDLIGLQTVISKLEDHLKSTNEKLGNFRKLIRTESNIKSREIYLNKVHAMVKEQHTIQSLLENYKTKLKKLESLKKLKSVEKQIPQQTKNSKLFELFHNYESKEAKFDNQSERTSETPKRKIVDKEEIVNNKGRKTKQIVIDNHGEAMKCLKAHVKKRITEEEQKVVAPNITNVEQTKHSDDDVQILGKAKAETEQVVILDQEKHIVNTEKAEELKHVKETKAMIEEKSDLSVDVPLPNAIVINNHSEAMQCLKVLQEYAMLNENYRAIGLLMETEKAFVSPPDVTDFEL